MFRQLSLALIMTFPCVVVHAAGLVGMFYWLERTWPRILQKFEILRNVLLLFWVFVALLSLHLIETAFWAACYLLCGCFDDFETALYYSISAYTTVGYGDVVLPLKWRLVGSVETCAGLLMFGWSTAYFWTVLSRFLRVRHQRLHGGGLEGR